MRRVALAVGVLVLVAVVVVAAQPPLAPPFPPGLQPVAPAAPPGGSQPLLPLPALGSPAPTGNTPPAAHAETPLSRLQPLSAYPPTTQDAVGGALRGAMWMAKAHQPNGRFDYGYNPALRQPLGGDHDIKQAQNALAMAQAARFCGDRSQVAIASQTILVLLASTKQPANEPNCRVPVQVSFVCNRVGFAATLALAIYELPNAGDRLADDAERLCEFIRRQLRTDGSVHYTDGPADVPTQIDPAGVNEYPGLALSALAASNAVRPAEWKKEAVKKGVACYTTLFRTKPHPMLAATVIPAATELYVQTKSPEAATAAFEMADWLCTLQIGSTNSRTPQWAGGFRVAANGPEGDAAPGTAETGLHLQSLACAYQLTRLTADLSRVGKYGAAAGAATRFLCSLQFTEANTRHFENNFRVNKLIGGFHVSPNDGNLRTDATACAVTGLLKYLSCGAEQH